MICARCQTENVPQARFCIRCGYALAPSVGPGYLADATSPPALAIPPVIAPPQAAQPGYGVGFDAPPGSSPQQIPPAPSSFAYPSQPLGQAPAPRPGLSTPLTQQRPMVRGFVIATIGNAVAVLAYFALHYIELPLVGGYSGSQLAGDISAAYSLASSACATFQQAGNTTCSVPPIDPSLVLWAEVLLAAVAAGLAGVQWVRISQSGMSGSDGAKIGILVASGLSLLLIIGVMLLLQASANSLLGQANLGASINLFQYLGIGYWLMVLGTLAGIVGAIMQMRSDY